MNRIIITALLAIGFSMAAPTASAWDCNYWHQSSNPKAECYVPPAGVGGSQTQDQTQGQGQNQGQGQGQIANGGAGGKGGAGGTGVGIGQGGNSKATGGNSDATSTATGGAVNGSGNSRNDNTLTNRIRNDNTNTSTSTGGSVGDTSSTSGAAVDSSGNSAVNVDASDRSNTTIKGAKVNTYIPGDLPANAMTIVPGSYITTAGDTSCGVLATKIQVPVYQWNKRGTKKVQVGYDEDIAPVFINGVQTDYQRVDLPNGGYYLRGSAVTYVLSTYGSSNGSQLGAQGYGPGGGGGISYGSGRSYSQAGVRLVIRSCIAAAYPATPAPAIVKKPAAAPKRHYKRKASAPAKCYARKEVACRV